MNSGSDAVKFPSFNQFFHAITGYEPYAWQSELAQAIDFDEWPACIEVPTGLGKTAIILVAVYDLARQLDHGVQHESRTAPQRIFHVVNRRTLVESTGAFIERLATRVDDGAEDPRIAPVRHALRKLLGQDDGRTIATGLVHGDSPRDRGWLRATGCTIVTLTPHQFVSRLLMRGFAVSSARRPIDAGLVGVDRLVLFDEPHLATSAVQTILDAERLQNRASAQLGIPVGHTVLLGATLPLALKKIMGGRRTLSLSDRDAFDGAGSGPASSGSRGADEASPASMFGRRLFAARRLHLDRVRGTSDGAIVDKMASRAREMIGDGNRSVVVFANTVALAQAVYRKLEAAGNSSRAIHPTETRLITSRFRSIDRNDLGSDHPGITVATQCLEVGVDISFDGLVTEAASWDALVQRLGRLNRDGSKARSDAYLVMSGSGDVRRGTAAVYGEEIVRAALQVFGAAAHPDVDGIDVSPAALMALRRNSDVSGLDGDLSRTATLHSGLLPVMTQTRPVPSPDLPVEAFINGPDHPTDRDVEVCWRYQVDAVSNFSFDDVFAAEMVSVPRSSLARLLRSEPADDAAAPVTDLAVASPGLVQSSGSVSHSPVRKVRVWDTGTEQWRAGRSINDVLRAERVVMPVTLGGYTRTLGWTGHGGCVDDVHLLAAVRALNAGPQRGDTRRRRLHLALSRPALVTPLMHELWHSASHQKGEATSEVVTPDWADRVDEIDFVVESSATMSPLYELWSTLRELDEADQLSMTPVIAMVQERIPEILERWLATTMDSGSGVSVKIEDIDGELRYPDDDGMSVQPSDAASYRTVTCSVLIELLTEQDHGPAAGASVVELAAHLEQVGECAGQDASAAGLHAGLVAKLGAAGRWHDAGKAFPPFQSFLRSRSGIGDPVGAARPPLLAKSIPPGSGGKHASYAEDWRARSAAGLPIGFRHEAATVAQLRDAGADVLVEHLSGAHHGWYRPMFPPVRGIQVRGFAHADDFRYLNTHYGPWGLAYLEAVLRLADWRVSASPPVLRPSTARSVSSVGVPAAPELVVDRQYWGRILDSPSRTAFVGTQSRSYPLDGLVTHPLTGWFAAVGMLAAAHDAGDDAASLYWTSKARGLTPQYPVLATQRDIRDIVSNAMDSERWSARERLVVRWLDPDGGGKLKGRGLQRKYQKLRPAGRVRNILLRSDSAEDPTLLPILGLVADAMSADSLSQVDLPIMPFANNSSYPKVALDFAHRADAVSECIAALYDVNRGYRGTACDGGMDRPRSAAPLVNGLGGYADQRQVRVALAPLVLYAMGRLGNTGAAPLGITSRNGTPILCLPAPTRLTTFAALQSMLIAGRAPGRWAWEAIGGGWVYAATRDSFTGRRDDSVWSGSIVQRSDGLPGERR